MQLPRISRYASLDKDQANEVHNAIVAVESGLEPRDFTLVARDSEGEGRPEFDRLAYNPEPAFSILFHASDLYIAAPGEPRAHIQDKSWEVRIKLVVEWLHKIVV